MSVSFKRSELLRAHGDGVDLLLRAYATDEVIAEASNEVTDFRQSSTVTEESYSRILWEQSLRCGVLLQQTFEVPLHRWKTSGDAGTNP